LWFVYFLFIFALSLSEFGALNDETVSFRIRLRPVGEGYVIYPEYDGLPIIISKVMQAKGDELRAAPDMVTQDDFTCLLISQKTVSIIIFSTFTLAKTYLSSSNQRFQGGVWKERTFCMGRAFERYLLTPYTPT